MTTFRNTIVNADCLHILPQLPAESVHFILTDPPYVTRYKAYDGRTVPNDDNAAWLKPAFAEMYRVLGPNSFCVSFYGWPQADRFMKTYRDPGSRVVDISFSRSATVIDQVCPLSARMRAFACEGNPEAAAGHDRARY